MTHTETAAPADEAAPAFREDWDRWHRAREDASLSPYGTASLVATNWLAGPAAPQPEAPGLWHAEGGRVVGSGLGDVPLAAPGAEPERRDVWELAPGDQLTDGTRRFVAFARQDQLALRVHDPASATRAAVTRIATWEPDPAWALTGRFVPASDGETVAVTTIDGVTGPAPVAGVVELALPTGHDVRLTVTRGPRGLSAVFGDATNGEESYRFRFVGVGLSEEDGTALVDLNRAFLPPCSFSDHYICPFPVPGNRWDAPVRAGERAVVLRDGHESITGIH